MTRDVTAAVTEVLNKAIENSGREMTLPRSNRFLEFNINRACEDHGVKRRKRKPGKPRPWSRDDRKRLQRYMEKGRTPEQIGAKLDRTVSAVTQQWRKQQLAIKATAKRGKQVDRGSPRGSSQESSASS